MAITDLTGTTWYVPSGWTCDAFYGHFSVTGFLTADDSYDTAFTDYAISAMKIGYRSGDGYAGFITFSNQCRLAGHDFTLTITGGDVTNTKLISWLETYGTMLKVTDLTNTTWTISNDFTVFSGGNVSISGSVECGDYVVNGEGGAILFGGSFAHFFGNSKGQVVMPCFQYNATSKELNYKTASTNKTTVSLPLTLKITSGDDVANPALIAWLSQYGELQEENKPTKTLKGKWKFKDDPAMPEGLSIINQAINFKARNGKSYEEIIVASQYIDYVLVGGVTETFVYNYIDGGFWSGVNGQVVDFGETEQTVTQEFYDWFTANARLLPKFTRLYIGNIVATAGSKCFKRLTTEKPSAEITDLTNTTWYVPSGWSAYDVGVFDINGTFTRSTTNLPDSSYTFKKMWVGSKDDSGVYTPIENKVVFKGSSQNYAYGNNYTLTISITGGTDVTNADLIAWLETYGELL